MRWLFLALALAACPAATDSDTDPVDAECDPVGDDAVMNGLFNAPLADDVEVIEKTPTHPGDPGPDGLPSP